MSRIPVVVMGAAGRDFHNFNLRLRHDATRNVVAFTAAQIPYIVGRTYPPALAGPHYPDGIPIVDESELEDTIRRNLVREVYFSYSDVSYAYVMSRAARVQAAGADFVLPDPTALMLPARRPTVAVCAVRTGSGKSQTTRFVTAALRKHGLKVAVIRHPMPYGDLTAQRSQRFASLRDMELAHCTIEEMEEYEPHIAAGSVVFAGIDYADIARAAEAEADVLVWDGGNNDLPFIKPDLHIVVADPHRVGHERAYYPGEVNARMADLFVINKEDSAEPANIAALVSSLHELRPQAAIAHAESEIIVGDANAIRGKRVLCVEDGPTLTHGDMKYGAAVIAAQRFGAAELVDPRPFVEGTLKQAYATYPNIGPLLPALGYSAEQIKDLGATIDRVPADLVLVGTPIDLSRVVKFNKPALRVRYELKERGEPILSRAIDQFVQQRTGR